MSTPTAAYARRQREKELHAAYLERQFRFKIGRISSLPQLREMLPTATPAEARVIQARLDHMTRRRAQYNAKREREAARIQAAAERDQDARLAR